MISSQGNPYLHRFSFLQNKIHGTLAIINHTLFSKGNPMLRALLHTLLCTTLIATAQKDQQNFSMQCKQSIKMSGSSAIAVGIGALAHSILFHIKKTYGPQVHVKVPYALDIIGLGVPFVAVQLSRLLPQTMQNSKNSDLFLGVCSEFGWILSKIAWEYEHTTENSIS
jgi:hypothetical protein